MRNFRIALALFTFLFTTPLVSYAQVKPTAAVASAKGIDATNSKAAVELARAAYAALGGDKFRNLKSISLTGDGWAMSPMQEEPIPLQFHLIATADRIRIDVAASFGTILLI